MKVINKLTFVRSPRHPSPRSKLTSGGNVDDKSIFANYICGEGIEYN